MDSATTLSRSTIIFLAANGFQDQELFVPFAICRQKKISCLIVSVDKSEFIKSQSGIVIKQNMHISERNLVNFQGVVIPGGAAGVRNLLQNKQVIKLVTQFYKSNKLVAAICAGPLVLAKADVIKNHKFTCFPNKLVISSCQAAGGHYCTTKSVYSSQNLITSTGPTTATDFGNAIVKYLLKQSQSLE